MTKQINRISGEQGSGFKTWIVPEIDGGGKILSSAEKEDRERKEREERQRGEVVGELIDEREFSGPITAAELERITEQAHQEGYQAGFDQGQAEGFRIGSEQGEHQALAETRQQVSEQLDSLSVLAEGLGDPFETHTQHLHQLLLNTVIALTKTVVRRELAIDSGEISNLVQLAINALPKKTDRITIHLHPRDIGLLQKHFPNKAKQWPLIPDSELSVGGVIVRDQDSVVDFSVENQLAVLAERFIKGELQGDELQGQFSNEKGGLENQVDDHNPSVQNQSTQTQSTPIQSDGEDQQ